MILGPFGDKQTQMAVSPQMALERWGHTNPEEPSVRLILQGKSGGLQY